MTEDRFVEAIHDGAVSAIGELEDSDWLNSLTPEQGELVSDELTYDAERAEFMAEIAPAMERLRQAAESKIAAFQASL